MRFMYHGEMCTVEFGKYIVNGNTSITLFTENGQPMTVATINLGSLRQNLVAIKNYSENEGIEEVLIANGVIKDGVIYRVESGYVQAPVYELTDESLEIIKQEENRG